MRDLIPRSGPAPGTVLGLAALVIALAGTAIAGPLAAEPTFKLDKKEKKQVRKIVRKEINAAAPSLSVRRAARADSADRADTATTAENATNAVNATNATTAANATNATNADNATNANNAANADRVDGHDAVCPAGTFLQGGTCFDTAVRFPMTPWNGATTCTDAGGRLPSVTELLSIRDVAGVDLGPSGDGHWADLTYDDDGVEEAAMVVDTGDVEFAAVGMLNQMRCAFDLVR
jgi:cell wall-associated NlpC family hydrolase